MEVDREELDAHIEEMQSELAAMEFLRDVLNSRDEGFIDIDEDGRCYPVESACPNTL